MRNGVRAVIGPDVGIDPFAVITMGWPSGGVDVEETAPPQRRIVVSEDTSAPDPSAASAPRIVASRRHVVRNGFLGGTRLC